MRVSDILSICFVEEEQLISKMKRFDWKYEFSENTNHIKKCEQELTLIENSVYQIWKTNPTRAINLWNQYCPIIPEGEFVQPSFIFKLQAQEK